MSDKLLANRYEIVEKIGEGGMAYVYKGRDTLLNRFVAIKVLKPEYTQNEKFVENFIKESQAAARLNNQNIVAVYDVGNEGRIHYIVMELVTGKTLSSIIKEKGKLDYLDAIKIAKQVLRALSDAHKNQIVHRDVKPHNVIITNSGVAKLADFGIARPVSKESIEEGDEEVMGSVHYFSPEQARGTYVDERSDIYSLGIVLYEMLTGEVPFDGESAVEVAVKHINSPMPKVLSKVENLPPKLGKIIDKATAKYQSNRYATADEMIKDLESIEYVISVMGDKAFGLTTTNVKEKEDSQDKKKKNQIISRVKKDLKTKEDKKKAFEAKTNIIFLVSLVVCLILGILFVGFISGWFDRDVEVSVPDFVGMTYEEAISEAAKYGLTITRGEDVYSQTQDIGYVESQIPTDGSIVNEGTAVKIYVSKGKKNNVVPFVTGMSLDKAKATLEANGFEVGNVTESASSQGKGVVIDQGVTAGSTVKRGTKIDLVISNGKGDNLVEMVYLIGKDFETAKSDLESMGLKVGTITYTEVKSGASNIVTKQSIKAGYEVEKGESIDLQLTKIADNNTNENNSNNENSENTENNGGN